MLDQNMSFSKCIYDGTVTKYDMMMEVFTCTVGRWGNADVEWETCKRGEK